MGAGNVSQEPQEMSKGAYDVLSPPSIMLQKYPTVTPGGFSRIPARIQGVKTYRVFISAP